MVKPSLNRERSSTDSQIEERVHIGGMASLWSVTRPDIATPMLMKIPKIGEGQDPAAIVSFEMEQMIAPRLSGVHVPKFIAAGDFAVQPYIVMERIPGATLWKRLSEFPCPMQKPSISAPRSQPRSTTCTGSTSFISTSSRATSCFAPAARRFCWISDCRITPSCRI